MIQWDQISNTRQRWMVYRAVRQLEPNANFQNIRTALCQDFSVQISPAWIQRRLDWFTEVDILRVERTRSRRPKLIWFSTEKHEAALRKTDT